MQYFNSVHENGITYSCDNLRMAFELNPLYADRFTNYLELGIQFESYPQSSGLYRYRHLVSAKYDSDSSMTIGFSFNGNDRKTDKYKGYLDFNPNKVSHFEQFWNDYRFIVGCCHSIEIKRIDLAIDIPSKRQYLLLEKDKRKYAIDMYSSENKTEYLGKRSNVGFVKLYNKTIESKLDYDLTRLEITSEPLTEKVMEHFPNVYDISKPIQYGMDLEALNDTEKWILEAEYERIIKGEDEGLEKFKKIGRKMREKLKPYLLPDECRITPSKTAIASVITSIYEAF